MPKQHTRGTGREPRTPRLGDWMALSGPLVSDAFRLDNNEVDIVMRTLKCRFREQTPRVDSVLLPQEVRTTMGRGARRPLAHRGAVAKAFLPTRRTWLANHLSERPGAEHPVAPALDLLDHIEQLARRLGVHEGFERASLDAALAEAARLAGGSAQDEPAAIFVAFARRSRAFGKLSESFVPAVTRAQAIAVGYELLIEEFRVANAPRRCLAR